MIKLGEAVRLHAIQPYDRRNGESTESPSVHETLSNGEAQHQGPGPREAPNAPSPGWPYSLLARCHLDQLGGPRL